MKILIGLLCLLLSVGLVWAQVYTGPPQPTALVCAFNTINPTPIAGQFYYVQCNSSGQIVIR